MMKKIRTVIFGIALYTSASAQSVAAIDSVVKSDSASRAQVFPADSGSGYQPGTITGNGPFWPDGWWIPAQDTCKLVPTPTRYIVTITEPNPCNARTRTMLPRTKASAIAIGYLNTGKTMHFGVSFHAIVPAGKTKE